MASVAVNGIVAEGPGSQSAAETSRQPELVIGLLASPGPASELTESLAGEIADRLAGQLPGVRWRVEFVSDRLAEPPTDLSALIEAGRRRLLERGWHLAVCVTDLPLQTARRPVIAHVSATHGVAVLSMPALGPVAVRKRTAETIVRLVGHILGDLAPASDAAPLAQTVTRRMRELGGRTERGEHGVGFVARVITGNLWLLLGMLRANRPWRLALRLMRALAVAFAAGVFALVTSDIWRLSHYLGTLRLTVICLGSVAGITVTIVVATGLWERSPRPAAREQVALFNIVTAATVGLGVATLYLALFAIMLAAALLLVPGNLLGLVLGQPVGVADQVRLAWLATSIATLGGALGAALESGETVREAAYTYQPDTQIDAVAGPRLRAAAFHGLSHQRAATATARAGERGPGPPRRRVPRILLSSESRIRLRGGASPPCRSWFGLRIVPSGLIYSFLSGLLLSFHEPVGHGVPGPGSQPFPRSLVTSRWLSPIAANARSSISSSRSPALAKSWAVRPGSSRRAKPISCAGCSAQAPRPHRRSLATPRGWPARRPSHPRHPLGPGPDRCPSPPGPDPGRSKPTATPSARHP
jgi:hypothetical protein